MMGSFRIRNVVASAMMVTAAFVLASCAKPAADKAAADSASALTASATATPAANGAASEEEANIASCKGFIDEVMNKGDMSAIDKYCDAAFVDHNPPPGSGTDLAAFKKGMTEWLGMIKGAKMSVDDIFAKGDLVVV